MNFCIVINIKWSKTKFIVKVWLNEIISTLKRRCRNHVIIFKEFDMGVK